jgi:hypothetical protein
MDYIISVKIKNSNWCEQAEKYSCIKEFELWDNNKTPRYKRGISFKFNFKIHSIEKRRKSSYILKLFKKYSDNYVDVKLENVSVFIFKGESEEALVISESLIDQIIEQKKPNGKQYINCYLYDTVVHEFSPNLWLSIEHAELLNQSGYTKIFSPEIKLYSEEGVF